MREIKPNIYAVGAIDWDARLFDRLIPLPDGTSYNSYLVQGNEKTALLDTVDPAKTEVLLDNLLRLGINKIDQHWLFRVGNIHPAHSHRDNFRPRSRNRIAGFFKVFIFAGADNQPR